jgi:hypothetical protein
MDNKLSVRRIFSSPTYIHSHESALSKGTLKDDLAISEIAMQNMINRNYNNILKSAQNLERISKDPAVQQ